MAITPGFQPGDDGSIPFTRSIDKNKSLFQNKNMRFAAMLKSDEAAFRQGLHQWYLSSRQGWDIQEQVSKLLDELRARLNGDMEIVVCSDGRQIAHQKTQAVAQLLKIEARVDTRYAVEWTTDLLQQLAIEVANKIFVIFARDEIVDQSYASLCEELGIALSNRSIKSNEGFLIDRENGTIQLLTLPAEEL